MSLEQIEDTSDIFGESSRATVRSPSGSQRTLRTPYLPIPQDDGLKRLFEDNRVALNKMGRLLNYRLSHTSPKLYPVDIANMVFSLTIGGMALVLYWRPTLEFSNEFAGDSVFAEVLFEGSVNLANFGVSVWTASETFKTFEETLPSQVRREINPHYAKDKCLGYIKIAGLGTFAVLSAVPYALAIKASAVESIVIGAANTVLNYFGLTNAANHFKSLHNQWKLKISKNEDFIAYQKILTALRHVVSSIEEAAMKTKTIPANLAVAQVDGPLENIPSQIEAVNLLKALANEAARNKVEQPLPLDTTQFLIKRMAPAVVGIGLEGGLLVFLLKTFENLRKKNIDQNIQIPFTGVVSVPFLYLAFTFGITAMLDLVSAAEGNKSLARHLYPKRTAAALFASTVVCSLSFATVADLVNHSEYFEKDGPLSQYRLHAVIYAAIGAFIFNSYANSKLVTKVVEYLARIWGKEDIKNLASWITGMEAFKKDLGDMDPTVLIESLKDKMLSDEDRRNLLPVLDFGDAITLLNKPLPVSDSIRTPLLKQQRSQQKMINDDIEAREDRLLDEYEGNDQGFLSKASSFFSGIPNPLKNVSFPKVSFQNPFRDCHFVNKDHGAIIEEDDVDRLILEDEQRLLTK